MKAQRLVLDERISTSRLRRPFPFPAPADHVTRFFERVAGMSSIFVGNICNQRCIYCDTPRQPVTCLTAEDARRRVDRMAELGIRRLMFVGGEPTIWRELPGLIERARARGIPDVFIATNGLMLAYRQYVTTLLDAGLTGLELSFDDFDPATQRLLSANDQADVLLAKALENLLPQKDLFLFFLAVVTRVNRAHLPAYLDRLQELGERRGAPIPAIFTHLKPITFAYENRDLLVEPVSVAAASIVAAVAAGVERGLQIIHKELPPCQTPGYEQYAWEANLVEYCVTPDAAETASVQSPMLAKGPRCGECRYDDTCVGVYRNYVEHFGWDEFRPVGVTPARAGGAGRGDAVRFFQRVRLRDCLGEPLSLDQLFGVLLHRAPTEAFTARAIRERWEELLRDAPTPVARSRIHAYLHLPFCTSRCSYCLFYSEALESPGQIDDYLTRRLFPEMEFFSDAFRGVPLGFLAVGGGSPSVLSPAQLERLMAKFHHFYQLSPDGVAIFECNPRHVTPEKMRLLRDLGITRISIGIQSLNRARLRPVNRGYQTEAMVKRAIAAIQDAGFRDGLNVDLMAGLAGEGVDTVLESFAALARLQVDTIYINLLHQVGPITVRATGTSAPGAADAGVAPPAERVRLFGELRRRLPPFAADLGYEFRPLCGPITIEDDDWAFIRRDAQGALRPHSYGRTDEDDMRLPLRNNSVVSFGPAGRARVAGGHFYWDQTTLATPFSPDAPHYQGYRVDRAFRPLWQALIALREGQAASLAEVRRDFGPAAAAALDEMYRRSCREDSGDGEPPSLCMCQLGGLKGADGRALDLARLFEHVIGIEIGARRLRLRLQRATEGDRPFCEARGLALQLQQPEGGGAADSAVLDVVRATLDEVAGAHQGRCLAETTQALQRALDARLRSVDVGHEVRVSAPEIRSFLASRHVLRSIL